MAIVAVSLFAHSTESRNYSFLCPDSVHLKNCIPVEKNKYLQGNGLDDHFDKKQAYSHMYRELIKAYSFINKILKTNYTSSILTANSIEISKTMYVENTLAEAMCSLKKLIKIQQLNSRQDTTDYNQQVWFNYLEKAWGLCQLAENCHHQGLQCIKSEVKFILQLKRYLEFGLRLIKKLCFTLPADDYIQDCNPQIGL